MQLPQPGATYDARNEAEARRTIALEIDRLARLINTNSNAVYTTDEADAKFVDVAGDTMTGDLTLGTAGSVLKRSVTYPGLGVSVKASASVANNGTLLLGAGDMLGLALIVGDNAAAAIVVLGGAANDTSVTAVRGAWTKTAGTAASYNVYWDGAHYTLQNKSGGAVIFRVVRFGDPATM